MVSAHLGCPRALSPGLGPTRANSGQLGSSRVISVALGLLSGCSRVALGGSRGALVNPPAISGCCRVLSGPLGSSRVPSGHLASSRVPSAPCQAPAQASRARLAGARRRARRARRAAVRRARLRSRRDRRQCRLLSSLREGGRRTRRQPRKGVRCGHPEKEKRRWWGEGQAGPSRLHVPPTGAGTAFKVRGPVRVGERRCGRVSERAGGRRHVFGPRAKPRAEDNDVYLAHAHILARVPPPPHTPTPTV